MGRDRKANDAREPEDKLDRILAGLEAINHRISTVEEVLGKQQRFIDQIGKSALERYIDGANVEEACGVDPSHIRRNQLMGEIPKLENGEDVAAKVRRQKKQQLGARIYAAYCWMFVILMGLSFVNKLPVLEVEAACDKPTLLSTSYLLSRTMHIPVLLSILYVFVIFGIQKIMKDREPFNLRYPLALWSLAIGAFSLLGSLRTVPVLIKIINKVGFGASICGDTREDWLFNNAAGFWTGLFILSKVPELIDTLFIVLRKRQLITLHWYHHITVMLFCWHSWGTHCLSGIYFAAMNLTVHAFMYFFYFLAALGYRPTAFAMYITVIQILQMLAGTFITTYIVYHMTYIVPQDVFNLHALTSMEWNLNADLAYDPSPACKVNPGNALAGLAMYASYLWLFCVFFYYAYLQPQTKPKVLQEKKTQ